MAELASYPESTVLAVMNSTPVADGVVVDHLDDPLPAATILRLLDGDGSATQVRALRAARDTTQSITRSRATITDLLPHLAAVVRRPFVVDNTLRWKLDAPAEDLPAARFIAAWCEVTEKYPGRLRPCANPECTKFLIDHSKPNTARWCSMATCGNRLKARRHQARRTAGG